MPIYTKKGDAGETSVLGGKKVSKHCLEIHVVGSLDELNASLGIALVYIQDKDLNECLQKIQNDLFKIGSEIASLQTPVEGTMKTVPIERVDEMEKIIDRFWEQLPALKNFILPGGNRAGAHLHVARAACRRAERELVAFGKTTAIRGELYKYLNRLSDFLFAAARWENWKSGVEETKVIG